MCNFAKDRWQLWPRPGAGHGVSPAEAAVAVPSVRQGRVWVRGAEGDGGDPRHDPAERLLQVTSDQAIRKRWQVVFLQFFLSAQLCNGTLRKFTKYLLSWSGPLEGLQYNNIFINSGNIKVLSCSGEVVWLDCVLEHCSEPRRLIVYFITCIKEMSLWGERKKCSISLMKTATATSPRWQLTTLLMWCKTSSICYLFRTSLCWGACRMKCWSGDWSPTTPTPCKHELEHLQSD